MMLTSAESASDTTEAKFRCPTCGADQPAADTCRRCRCDLSLVRVLRKQNAELRRNCLALLRQRRLLRATRLALRCYDLSSDESNARLLATCYLLQGNFASAAKLRGSVAK